MMIKVLGSAAGGGLPQWNCNGRNSADARKGAPEVAPRSQASVAVTADGAQWVLLNAAMLARAVYELGYELHHRPDWVRIPLQGILQLLGPRMTPQS